MIWILLRVEFTFAFLINVPKERPKRCKARQPKNEKMPSQLSERKVPVLGASSINQLNPLYSQYSYPPMIRRAESALISQFREKLPVQLISAIVRKKFHYFPYSDTCSWQLIVDSVINLTVPYILRKIELESETETGLQVSIKGAQVAAVIKIKPPVPRSIGEVPQISVLANLQGDTLKSTANI